MVFPIAPALIFGAGLLIRLLYLTITPFTVRAHDADAHLQYIQYVANHWRFPAAIQGWEFYQPPLYYLIAAGVDRLAGFLHLPAPLVLQLLSLVFFMAMLVFAYLIIKLAVKSRPIYLALFALVVFWPSGIIHSVRLGNDVLEYLTITAWLYHLGRWTKQRHLNDLDYAFVWANLALLTKLTGLIPLVITGIAYLIHLRFTSIPHRKLTANLIVSFVLLATSLMIAFRGQIFTGSSGLITNTANLNQALRVGNRPINYLSFDPVKFVTQPYTSAWEDNAGRQSFWFYWLKTSLFGEFTFDGLILKPLAQWLSALLLILIICIFISFLIIWRFLPKQKTADEGLNRLVRLYTPVSLFFIGAAIAIHVVYPYACSADFRYVFPIIIPALAIYGIHLETVSGKFVLVWRRLNLGLIWLMVGLSGWFFIQLFSSSVSLVR
ncbi:glycosyltransferase family 39 protein [Patescibacteria group bacterium]|nr:glycosyltransferase family 39 protein [Patescibacteria group bacterium]MCL5091227.1 glycosyltransferase family 39 protein [Patescibacteria group bacterium]